jgi:aryl-alcohol dehydrogenase-like predicted oxidoreductase
MQVSVLSLGSWRTYDRLPVEAGVAIMRAARDEGINFFDDARYDDETGKARAWGLVNWPADPAGVAVRAAPALGVAPPCAIQLPYSLVRRSWLEDATMTGVFEVSGAAGIASFSLAGGVLSGKYLSGPAAGRAAGTLEEARIAPAVVAAGELAVLAGRLDTTPAALALAFPLTNPIVTSVLFGATSTEQVRANCAAIGLLDRLGPDDLAELKRIGQPEA